MLALRTRKKSRLYIKSHKYVRRWRGKQGEWQYEYPKEPSKKSPGQMRRERKERARAKQETQARHLIEKLGGRILPSGPQTKMVVGGQTIDIPKEAEVMRFELLNNEFLLHRAVDDEGDIMHPERYMMTHRRSGKPTGYKAEEFLADPIVNFHNMIVMHGKEDIKNRLQQAPSIEKVAAKEKPKKKGSVIQQVSKNRLLDNGLKYDLQSQMKGEYYAPEAILDALENGDISAISELNGGCNETFLMDIPEWGEVSAVGVFKPASGETDLRATVPVGQFMLREKAAYILDQGLGFGMVPPTTLRQNVESEMGSFPAGSIQKFEAEVEHTDSDSISPDKVAKAAVFDLIAGNTDRHGMNYMVKVTDEDDEQLILIDNGLCFPEKRGLDKRGPMREFTCDFVDSFHGLDIPSDVTEAVSNVNWNELGERLKNEAHLSQDAVNGMIARAEWVEGLTEVPDHYDVVRFSW